MCLSHCVVVALGVVGAELRAARLLALDRRDDRRLGAVEHVAELDRAEHVLVEDRAAVVDRRPSPASSFRRRTISCAFVQALLVAVDGDVLVHHRAELVLDLRDPPAAALAAR